MFVCSPQSAPRFSKSRSSRCRKLRPDLPEGRTSWSRRRPPRPRVPRVGSLLSACQQSGCRARSPGASSGQTHSPRCGRVDSSDWYAADGAFEDEQRRKPRASACVSDLAHSSSFSLMKPRTPTAVNGTRWPCPSGSRATANRGPVLAINFRNRCGPPSAPRPLPASPKPIPVKSKPQHRPPRESYGSSSARSRAAIVAHSKGRAPTATCP